MRIAAIFLFVLTLRQANGQTDHNYSSTLHFFKVSVDSFKLNNGITYNCSITNISIYRQSDKTLVEKIEPPENSFGCDMDQGQIFRMSDINFDGVTDFMIIEHVPAAPNLPYYYWRYDEVNERFVRDTTLEHITTPEFDQEQKSIYSSWRAGWNHYGTSTYKYLNGKITLVEETEMQDDPDTPGQRVTTVKKLEDGEMKLVERTVEQVEED